MLPTDIQIDLELYEWQQVPVRVGEIIKVAKPIRQTLKKVIRNLPAQPGYGYVFYHPDDHKLHAVLGDSDDESTYNKWENALKAIKGITNVVVADEYHPKDRDDWVLIKRAAPLGLLGGMQKGLGTMTGGASPLTNSIAGALLTGGLGYGTGWLLEHLFPERFVRRGRLRKTLGAVGAGLGAVPGMWQWSVNARRGNKGPWGSLVTPNRATQYEPDLGEDMESYWKSTGNDVMPFDGMEVQAADLAGMREWLGELPDCDERFVRAAEGRCKEALAPWRSNQGAGGAGLRPVPMDAFNRAIWNDVRAGMTAGRNPFGTKAWQGDNTQGMHTPPPVAAATTAINTGIQDMYGGRSSLSPRHFIKGLATAGVDLATAHIVGGTLGALGGLTPEAQKNLQNIGLWGGLIRGTVGSMMGMR
jgi:hypothetical protein